MTAVPTCLSVAVQTNEEPTKIQASAKEWFVEIMYKGCRSN